MKVYVVMQPASDPYGGSDCPLEVYLSEVKAQAYCDFHNKALKYEFDRLYVQEFDVVDGKDN